jgi:cell volume regulation protein A
VPALGVAVVLMFVARPLAVWLCLMPFRFSGRETTFIAWVGLRGAVPIVLAMFPLLAGTPDAVLLFDVAFVVVLTSLLVQGGTIRWLARRLRVALPEPGDEREARAVFRDFALDPRLPVEEVCAFYSLPVPPRAALPVAEWMAEALKRPPVVGDSVSLGPAALAVRAMEQGRITGVGLGLPSSHDPGSIG